MKYIGRIEWFIVFSDAIWKEAPSGAKSRNLSVDVNQMVDVGMKNLG